MRRPSPAMVVALIALFVALGGSSYAALRIGSKQIKNNSVRSGDLRNNDVSTKDIRNRSLLEQDFKAGQLPAGPAGAAGPQGPQGPPGPSAVYQTRFAYTSPGEVVPTASYTTLNTLTVPSGSYDVRTTIGITNGNAALDGVVCDVGPPVGSVERFSVISPTNTLAYGSGGIATTLPAGGTITLRCITNGAGPVRRRASTLTAVKVGAIVQQ